MTPAPPDDPSSNFKRLAEQDVRSSSLVRDFVQFLAHNKKWWLIPIILAMLAIGLLLVLKTSALAPFIYTLF